MLRSESEITWGEWYCVAGTQCGAKRLAAVEDADPRQQLATCNSQELGAAAYCPARSWACDPEEMATIDQYARHGQRRRG